MIVKTKCAVNPITVELKTSPQLRFRTEYPCDLELSSIGYAVCRFVAHTPSLLNRLAAESCRLRFERGKARRPIRRRCTAPAALLELPGVWATVDLLVGPEDITVTGLWLSAQLPEPSGERSAF